MMLPYASSVHFHSCHGSLISTISWPLSYSSIVCWLHTSPSSFPRWTTERLFWNKNLIFFSHKMLSRFPVSLEKRVKLLGWKKAQNEGVPAPFRSKLISSSSPPISHAAFEWAMLALTSQTLWILFLLYRSFSLQPFLFSTQHLRLAPQILI